jgi:hypothetical protein
MKRTRPKCLIVVSTSILALSLLAASPAGAAVTRAPVTRTFSFIGGPRSKTVTCATIRRFARYLPADPPAGRQWCTPSTGSVSDGVRTTQPDVESPTTPGLPAAGNAVASASAIRCARAA